MADFNSLAVKSVFIEALGSTFVEVTLNDVNEDDLLEAIDADKAVAYYGDNTLLDLIGRDAAIAYFGIEEKE